MDKQPPLIVLKIGGAVFTDRDSDRPKLNRKNLQRIAQEIGEAYNPDRIRLLFIHGAGSFGHPIVSRTGIHHGIHDSHQRLSLAETQRLQNWLNILVVKSLIAEGVPAIPIQASTNAILANGRLERMDLEVVRGLMEWKMVPTLYGVPAFDRLQGCSILSGDQIAPYVAVRLGASQILHGTNVRGVFTDDPNRNPAAQFIPRIDVRDRNSLEMWLKSSSSVDVTGGMHNKVRELLETGITSQIFDAMTPGNLQRALKGVVVGTIIQPF
jgi:isopentenyl phosphate kinase